MGHPAGLAWLALPARNKSVSTTSALVSDPVAAVPEFRRNPMIDHIPQHLGSPTVFNEPEGIAAELEIVAALIDAIGSVALDVDAAFHVGNELITCRVARLKPDIGDAYDRNVCPSISAIGAT